MSDGVGADNIDEKAFSALLSTLEKLIKPSYVKVFLRRAEKCSGREGLLSTVLGSSDYLFDEYICALQEAGYRSHFYHGDEPNDLTRLAMPVPIQRKLDSMQPGESNEYLKSMLFTRCMYCEIFGLMEIVKSGELEERLQYEKNQIHAGSASCERAVIAGV